MKTTAALLAASFALTAAAGQGVTFDTPVTYTQPVTYAAGVTYLAPVTYGAEVKTVAAAEPVVLEGIVVTPKRTYTASEWDAHLLAREEGPAPRLLPVHRMHKRGGDWTGVMKSFLPVFH